MRRFCDHNPVSVLLYYLIVVTVSMFSMNPVLHLISFVGGILQFSFQHTGNKLKTHLFFVMIGLILAFIAPVFSHNGATVLFVVNDNPITREAFIFGINAAVMVVGVLYLFRVFSIIMTSDRLLYLFGRFSPKTALILSMGLRYIPMLREKSRQIKAAQTAIGINRDDNAIDRIKAGINVFSATVSWGLENGIITADSMAARWYGTKKRTQFKLFNFYRNDALLICMTVVLSIPTIAALAEGNFITDFYPYFKMSGFGAFAIAGYIAFAVLMLLPIICDITAFLKWKYREKSINEMGLQNNEIR